MNALRRACLVAGLIAATHTTAVSQSLGARTDGERLRVVVEGVRFLSGDALRKLHDGVPVVYVFRLTAHSSRLGNALTKSEYRFIISYDIFEEKFQVSRVRPAPRVASHLTIAAAEAAILDVLEVPIQSIRGAVPFWLRLEYEAEESTRADNSAVSLEGLVEIFSRTTTKESTRGVVESGPLRLSDLPRAPRGSTSP